MTAEQPEHRYGYVERPEIIPFIPEDARVVVDVGCSLGGFGAALRRTGRRIEIWGIDSDPTIASEASSHYDHFITGYYPNALEGRDVQFDCIVFNDVLEHMADPWEALRKTQRYLLPTGTVVASIPNVRYLPVLVRLLLRGDFTYAESGVMDKTHLRFFTKKTMRDLFESCGYQVSAMKGIVPWRERRWLAAIAPQSFEDAVYRQFVVAARLSPKPKSEAPAVPLRDRDAGENPARAGGGKRHEPR